ncbi:MAG: hypothetical protein R3D28_04195 [Geminicoccaceae bacterium]
MPHVTCTAGRSENFTLILGEAEIGMDLLQELAAGDAIGGDLIPGAEDVGVVPGEGAHALAGIEPSRLAGSFEHMLRS